MAPIYGDNLDGTFSFSRQAKHRQPTTEQSFADLSYEEIAQAKPLAGIRCPGPTAICVHTLLIPSRAPDADELGEEVGDAAQR